MKVNLPPNTRLHLTASPLARLAAGEAQAGGPPAAGGFPLAAAERVGRPKGAQVGHRMRTEREANGNGRPEGFPRPLVSGLRDPTANPADERLGGGRVISLV
ncbi:MAG: hypothetical protein N0A15_08890 [Anaerolineae bacterium]|nr:hypothetical protein [Anaerolineae bacterium]